LRRYYKQAIFGVTKRIGDGWCLNTSMPSVTCCVCHTKHSHFRSDLWRPWN